MQRSARSAEGAQFFPKVLIILNEHLRTEMSTFGACAISRAGPQCRVASKKGAIGIGLPKHSCDESRSHRIWPAALSFVPQVFGGSMGGRKLGRFRKECPVDQPVELPPLIGLRSGGFCKPHSLEAIHG